MNLIYIHGFTLVGTFFCFTWFSLCWVCFYNSRFVIYKADWNLFAKFVSEDD